MPKHYIKKKIKTSGIHMIFGHIFGVWGTLSGGMCDGKDRKGREAHPGLPDCQAISGKSLNLSGPGPQEL